jgi:hypothetical protein
VGCSVNLSQYLLIYVAFQALETHPDKAASQTMEEVKESATAKFRDVRGFTVCRGQLGLSNCAGARSIPSSQ